MNIKEINCSVCGSSEVIKRDGKWYCKSCDTFLSIKEENFEDNINFQNDVNIAEINLKLDPPRFDDAETKYESLVKEYPNSSTVYWGLLRSKYGIKYINNSNGKSVPICFKSKYVDFRKDGNYKRALELAESEDLKNKYISEGERIANTWKRWENEAKKLDFDVFLSFKSKDENGNSTEDSKLMQDLYTYLTERRLKVFYSPVSMREFTGKEYYDAYIFNALEKSKALIVCGTKPEYFTSLWVESEWSRYLSQIESEKKHKDSLILLCGDFNPSYELPRRICHRQCLSSASRTLFPDLLKAIDNVLSLAAKKNPFEHIYIPKIEQRVKKQSSQLNVQIGKITANKNRQNLTVFHSDFDIEDLTIETNKSNIQVTTDSLNTASILLQNKHFDEANKFYINCLNKDKTNGKAWMGLFACKAHDAQILLDLDARLPFTKRILKPKECNTISNLLLEIENMIKYACSKNDKNRILLFLTETVLISFLRNLSYKRTYQPFLFDFYRLLNFYDDSRLTAKKIIENNLIKLNKAYNSVIFQQFAKELVDDISTENVDEYSNTLEIIINVLDGNEEYNSAKEWNDLKLALYEGDFKSLTRAVYYSFKVSTYQKFVKQCKYLLIKDEVILLIEHNIEKMSKQDCGKFLRLIMKIEKYCFLKANLSNKYLANAQKLFGFLIKYKHRGRKHYLNWHFRNCRVIALNDNSSFFLNLLNFVDNKETDFYIRKLLSFGNLLLKNLYFENSKLCFQEISKYQENNFEASKGVVLTTIGYSCNSVKYFNIWALDINEFNKSLTFAPKVKSQQKFVDQLLISCIEKIKDPSFESNCAHFIVSMFKELVKCSTEDEENTKTKYIEPMAFFCLNIKAFDCAKDLAELSLQYKSKYNDKAHLVLLLASLNCRDEEDFVYCKEFNKSNIEYKALLNSCPNDYLLGKYKDLANKNYEYNKSKRPHQVEILDKAKYNYISLEERKIKRTKKIVMIVSIAISAVFASFEILGIVKCESVVAKVVGSISIPISSLLIWRFISVFSKGHASILSLVLQLLLTFVILLVSDKSGRNAFIMPHFVVFGLFAIVCIFIFTNYLGDKIIK